METIIKGLLNQPTLQDNFKSAFITKLLKGTAELRKPDASVLLDYGFGLKSNPKTLFQSQTGDRILLAVSIAHFDLFKARFHNDWFHGLIADTTTSLDYVRNIPLIMTVARRKEAMASTEEEKTDLKLNMETIEHFAEKRCVSAEPPLEPDDVFMTMPHLFLKLSDDEHECSIGVGHLLQAVPENYTSVVDPFIQNLDSTVLWRLKFTVQRLINWLVTIDIPGIGIWIVAIMESLASRGEFNLLRDLADQNAYKSKHEEV
ncbi:hypothetical protein BGZ58_010669 [Dissophora ornata]|nr:hypothetical protein BGZ58_010669 [Dissophora ornata]